MEKWNNEALHLKLNPQESSLLFMIDRYLDFFDRLYHYVSVTNALKLKDIECFRWYLAKIYETRCVHDYAANNGYGDVLRLHEKIKSLVKRLLVKEH